jgi:hypothetical protein
LKKKILFTVQHSAQFKAPQLLIDALNRSAEFEPVIYFSSENGYEFRWEREHCRSQGIRIIGDEAVAPVASPENTPSVAAVAGSSGGPVSWKLRLINRSPAFVRNFIYLNRLKKTVKKIIFGNAFDVLVVPEDAFPVHSAFVRYASEKRVPTVTLPFTFSDETEILLIYSARTSLSLIDRFFCLLFPRWRRTIMGKDVVWGKLQNALAYELSGLSPFTPWSLMGGKSDRMVVENEFSFDFFHKSGIDKRKMVQLGAVYQDVFYEKLQQGDSGRRAFVERYKLDGRPVILCGLFPIVQPLSSKFLLTLPETIVKLFDLRLETRFETIGDLLDFHLSTLTRNSKYQVLIHPHPRMNLNYISHIGETYGVKLLDCDISEAIPYCDIFVCDRSATARMAMTLGKPVICTTYGVHFGDYDQFSGFLKAGSNEEFVAAYDALTNDPDYFGKVIQHQQEAMKMFGPLDGKATERIFSFFRTLN